jgi:hypothetical protein
VLAIDRDHHPEHSNGEQCSIHWSFSCRSGTAARTPGRVSVDESSSWWRLVGAPAVTVKGVLAQNRVRETPLQAGVPADSE